MQNSFQPGGSCAAFIKLPSPSVAAGAGERRGSAAARRGSATLVQEIFQANRQGHFPEYLIAAHSQRVRLSAAVAPGRLLYKGKLSRV